MRRKNIYRLTRVWKSLGFLMMHAVLALACVQVFAQQAELEKSKFENARPNNEIEVSQRTISATAPTPDEAIRKRMESILRSTEKINDIEISVVDGLVKIAGTTDNKEFVEWSSAVAKNMDGVVGVVNNISYIKPTFISSDRFASEFQRLLGKVYEILPMVLVAGVVFLLFFFSASPLANMLMRPINYLSKSELIRMVVQRFITLFIMLVGFYFFLKIAGLTQFALAVISGTGVLGLILGFAFKDIAENFISSLLISAQRPFRLGDVIEVHGHKGVVRKVTARGTTLVDFDGNHIQIPNAIIYKNIIQNFSANPKLRGSFSMGIGYDASITLAQRLGLKLMRDHDAVLNDPEPQVLVASLGSSTVNLVIYYWVDGDVYAVNKVSSMLMRLIMREFERNGISMPDDAREIIFPDGVPVQLDHIHTGAGQSEKPLSNYNAVSSDRAVGLSERRIKHAVEDDAYVMEDLRSDTQDIKEQAAQARDPESGRNII